MHSEVGRTNAGYRRHICINGLFLDYAPSGMAVYTENLIRALSLLDPDTRYRLDVRRAWPAFSHQPNSETRRPLWPFSATGSRRNWLERADKFGWEVVAWPLECRGMQLAHSLYFAAPVVSPCPLVVTVHDCVPLHGAYTHSRAASLYAKIMAYTTHKAAAIITVSAYSRAEIAEKLSYPIDKIYVTPEAAPPNLHRIEDESALATVRHRYDLPLQYVLYLGGTEARKNISAIVRAWALGDSPNAVLVIVGRFPKDDPLFPDIPALVATLKLGDSVRFIPMIEPDDLAAVYSGALAFCYPSEYEGFGLPPLEAMACGTPVLASNATSLPEVVGRGGHLIPPDDIDAWHRAMVRAITDAEWRSELAQRGYQHVAGYSWEETARLTLDVYDRVLNS